MADYQAKVKGFLEYQEQELKNQQRIALYQAWHTAFLVAYAVHNPKKLPRLETLLRSIK